MILVPGWGALRAREVQVERDIRIYRMTAPSLVISVVLGASVAAAGAALAWRFAFDPSLADLERMLYAGLAAFFSLMGACALAEGLRSKLLLAPQAIEYRGLLNVTRLRRDEISGRRQISWGMGLSSTALIPKSGSPRQLAIAPGMATDAALEAWFGAIPDLDEETVRRFEAEIAADPEIGDSAGERLAKLKGARRRVMLLNVVAFVAAGLALWYPRPYMLVISVLAFLPWVALALLADSRKLYSLFNDQEEKRAGLEILLSIPGFALAFRAIDDAQLLEWEPALKAALLGGVLLTCCAAIVEPAIRRTWAGLLILFVACWYAFGGLTLANALGDRSSPRVYRAAVAAKEASSGKVVTWKLLLEPWGARATPEYAPVTREVFDSVRPGDRVCVDLYPGLLGIPWFQVRSCG